MNKQKTRKETNEAWEKTWKPLLYTKGKLDEKKISKEMKDLIFIYKQVGVVYCEITGNKLSKPMYYADTIIEEYNNQINEAYESGYSDGQDEYDS